MANILGDEFDNQLTGDGGDHVMFGFSGDDTFTTSDAGSETVLGGDGDDRVVYSGDWSDYVIARIFGGTYTISNGSTTDLLSGVETIDFNGDLYDLAGDPDSVITFPVISAPEAEFRLVEQGTSRAALELVAPISTPNAPYVFEVLSLPDAAVILNGQTVLAIGALLTVAEFENLTYSPPTSSPGNFQLQFRVSDGVDSEVIGVAVNITPGVDSLKTGSALADLLDGAFGDDVLTGLGGSDTLIGGAGRDTLSGGQGNDLYVNPFGDVVIEASGQGIDTISSNTHFALSGLAHVERLTLTGQANLNAVGNALANVLTGNEGNNRFRGGAGADTLIGGSGNDTYIDPAGDIIREYAGQGIDLVESQGHFSLAGVYHVENLTLTGAANVSATGNSYGNLLTGNAGNNRFRGGAGSDTIDGGAGDDVFVFGQISDSSGGGRDIVLNADLDEDGFDFAIIPVSIAAAVVVGVLRSSHFDGDLTSAIGVSQLGAFQAVLFDPSGGDLDLAGRQFLIVDANGVAGYQAGGDYVVQLDHATGILTIDDFT